MRKTYLLPGSLLTLVCMAAPTPSAVSDYPFSAHMLRHTVLLLIAAPLLALAIPAKNSAQRPLKALSGLAFRFPIFAWITGVGLMWIWHIPSLYNSMAMPGMEHHMSIIHSLSMLGGGMLFSWPVISPYPEYRLPPLNAVLYLSGACVFCSLLGLLLTFAPAGTYDHVNATDQQTGGLIMWVPCCFIYLSASMYLLIHWLSQKEELPRMQTSKP